MKYILVLSQNLYLRLKLKNYKNIRDVFIQKFIAIIFVPIGSY